MRIVIQRVSKASVSVNRITFGSINKGLLVLVGFEPQDSIEDLLWTAKKIVNLRIFDNKEGQMDLSIKQIQGEILVVSQFTLFGNVKKGHRPSYIRAEKAEKAKERYLSFCKIVEKILEKDIQKGIFQADMKVELINDGPVTILIDSKQKDL